MTDASSEPGKIDIGQVIRGTFAVLGRNLGTFFTLALILVGAPAGLLGLFLPPPENPLAFGPGYFLTTLAILITSAVLQGALIYGAVQDMNGARPGISDTLATGLRNFLPIVAVSIVFGLAVAFGLILLIVPGLMIATAWCVAVPSLVAERLSIGDAFGRSAELTRGNRWRIFALFLILWVVTMLISLIAGAIAGAGLAFGDPAAMARLNANPVFMAVNAVITAVSALFQATGLAVLYVELRKAKEGAGPGWLSEIFA